MRDQGFYVQMHLHTAESSRCARVGGADMARACKEAGYDLIIVTDHFFNANTTTDPGDGTGGSTGTQGGGESSSSPSPSGSQAA